MAMIDRNFTFATNGTVTANDLHNLIDSATIYQDLITGQQPITSVGTNYELLIADATNPNAAPNAVTVYDLFEDALTAGTYTNANISAALTYGTATGTRLVSTNATITTGTITTGVIPTLTSSTATFGTTTSTAATITSGTITNLASTTGTIATLNSTTGTITTGVIPTLTAGTTTSTAATITSGTVTNLASTTGTIATLNSTTGTITTGVIPTLTSTTLITTGTGTAAAPAIVPTGDTNTGIFFPAADTIAFSEGGAEAVRIGSSGNLLVGTTDAGITTGVGIKFVPSATISKMGIVQDTAANDSSYHSYNINATNNGYRFYVTTNGGISNFSANNVNLSDERLKTNIIPAGNYLDKICSIPVKTFNYKDQGEDTEKTIGIIAQEVELVIPELINNDGFGETPEDGIPLKTIYQTDLQYVLMRCIQELSAKVTALEAA